MDAFGMGGFLKMRTLITTVVVAAMMGGAAVASAGPEGKLSVTSANLTNGENIYKNGKGSVPACQSCHGADGMGDDNLGTPRLAGQIFQFVLKQLEDFAADRRKDMTMFVMNDNAKGLTEQDRVDVAAYVSQLKGEWTPSNLEEIAKTGMPVGKTWLGKEIVLYGLPEKGVPACRACHNYNGRGVDPLFPAIGEQRYVYLVNQLKQWRDGTRANDPEVGGKGAMREVAKNMSDEDIYNVAAYLTKASPYPPGDRRIPSRHVPIAFVR